jgi:predicted transcriptional regulator of viral defense system
MPLEQKILRRAKQLGGGAVFTRADFLDLGSTHAIGMVFQRLLKARRLRRVARGLYDVPRTHPMLGKLSATPEAIAQAIARRDGLRLEPTEAQAANLLNLSEQVPARVAYAVNRRGRRVQAGGRSIEFQQRSGRKMAAAQSSGLVMAALRSVGARHIKDHHIAHLRKLLPAAERRRLRKDLRYAPAWMHPHLRQIAAEKP